MDHQTFEYYFNMAIEDPPYHKSIYQAVAQTFSIKTALYPGCGFDIAPSLYIPYVAYIDNAAYAADFFAEHRLLLQELDRRKQYSQAFDISFYAADYHAQLGLPQFDLLISQHAGPVGQIMKPFLKPGGMLLIAEGPEDAALALRDPDYELVGTVQWDKNGARIVPELLSPQFYSPPQSEEIRIPIERNFCFRKAKLS